MMTRVLIYMNTVQFLDSRQKCSRSVQLMNSSPSLLVINSPFAYLRKFACLHMGV